MKSLFYCIALAVLVSACVNKAESQSSPFEGSSEVSPFREETLRRLGVKSSDPSHVLINGAVVQPGSGWDHVVSIRTGSAGCTATVVGKRVIITAAHCAGNGQTSVFSIKGVQYQCAMSRSPLYPGKDHDIAVGKCSSDIAGDIATIGGKVEKGKKLTLLGYGCISPGGGGGNDGTLRIGDATVVSFSGFDAVSTSGAALCYGDSGGPGFLQAETVKLAKLGVPVVLATINSKGNIRDTNYTTRLDTAESQSFLKDWATQNAVAICGINVTCGPGPGPGPGDSTKIVEENVAKGIKVTVEVSEAWSKANSVDLAKNAIIWIVKHLAGEQ